VNQLGQRSITAHHPSSIIPSSPSTLLIPVFVHHRSSQRSTRLFAIRSLSYILNVPKALVKRCQHSLKALLITQQPRHLHHCSVFDMAQAQKYKYFAVLGNSNSLLHSPSKYHNIMQSRFAQTLKPHVTNPRSSILQKSSSSPLSYWTHPNPRNAPSSQNFTITLNPSRIQHYPSSVSA
jgi:hypothetical protein